MIRWSGSYADDEEGEVTKAVARRVDDDHFVLDAFGTAPDGAQYTVQETSSTRES